MISDHPPLERLSELADGDLSPELARAVERHVAACAACRARLARLRALLASAAALPKTIEPPPDAWSDIRDRLSLRPRGIAVRGAGRLREWGLRAAAVMLLVGGAAAVTVVAVRPRLAVRAVKAAKDPALPPTVSAVERSYTQVVDELTATLRTQRGALSPATVATLERTLRVIDEAIAEARAALAADPSNGALVDVLAANYEQKVQLLRRASELPART